MVVVVVELVAEVVVAAKQLWVGVVG